MEHRRGNLGENFHLLDEPESDQSWPDHGMGEWKESHQGSSKDTDDVSDSHHEETGVLPSSSNDTGDQK